jgi:hypothetical protein
MRKKMKGKKLIETFVSNKIMDLAKKLDNNIQKQSSFKESDGINLKLKVEDGLFTIINSQKISKFYKKKPKKIEFTD